MTNPRIADAFTRFPEPVSSCLLRLRDLIYEVAGETPGVGPLEETLKWGQPSYVTAQTKAGTTIRLGQPKSHPSSSALFFHCQTNLVGRFRLLFGDRLEYEGNRAVILSDPIGLPEQIVKTCIAMALTYHLEKKSKPPKGS